jgi:hypothetical protein
MKKLIFLIIGLFLVLPVFSVYAEERPQLNVKLLSANSSHGGGWSDDLSANPGDNIEFRAEITNTGGSTARDVRIKVELRPNYPTVFPFAIANVTSPSSNYSTSDSTNLKINGSTQAKLTYVPGYLVGGYGSGSRLNPDSSSANITTQEISLGDLPAGNRIYQVAFMTNLNPTLATPTPIPTSTTPIFTPTPTSAPVPTSVMTTNQVDANLIIQTKNLTTNESSSSLVSASPQDIIEFIAQVSNTGKTSLNNASLKIVYEPTGGNVTNLGGTVYLTASNLPSYKSKRGSVMMKGTTTGHLEPDSSALEIPLGSLPSGSTTTQTFRARVVGIGPSPTILPTGAPSTGGTVIVTPTPASLQPVAPRSPSTGQPILFIATGLVSLSGLGLYLRKRASRFW